ncbi:MAG: bifunctional alpha/beta hydrolase/OsmC family protein [Pseudomonadota bacterium]
MARSQKVEFKGADGQTLAARLDLPEGKPRAFSLFAHCFTCSKDIFAASRIASTLAERGIAVLRFDFTGLGASEGEFANTNFSSNVQDLLHAVAYLRKTWEAPRLLVGHSLGGAAVLAAAGDVPEVGAVATIGAPGQVDHVLHNFGTSIEAIRNEGVAEVKLAGRPFTIKRQFVEDVEKQRLAERIATMRKALLVMHAPQDQTVGIDNATAIFRAAKHPKSFVSLDGADHLLSKRVDAIYAADVIAAWIGRQDGEEAQSAGAGATAGDHPEAGAGAGLPDGVVRVEETGAGQFQQRMRVGAHTVLADEPRSYGGDDTGPTPYDLLSMGLGACTSMTLRMYAARKGLDLEPVVVDVKHAKVHAQDCADCGEGHEGRIDRFERTIRLGGHVSDEMRSKLLEIADKCPVHRTLEQSAAVVTTLEDGKG